MALFQVSAIGQSGLHLPSVAKYVMLDMLSQLLFSFKREDIVDTAVKGSFPFSKELSLNYIK